MSVAMIFKEDLKIDDTQIQVHAGIVNFCALLGALVAGRTSDHKGRRCTISLASCIFLLGSLLMGFSPNCAILLMGRCVAGIGVGFALVIAPVYSAEVSATNNWGHLKDAKQVLLKVSNNNEEAESRLHVIKLAVRVDPNCNEDIATFKQDARGQGVTSKDKLLLATIGVGVTRTIFITSSTFFINKAGRRKLLLTSVGGMIVALVGLGFGLTIIVHQSRDQNAVWPLWLSIDTCYLYVMFFSMGPAPVTLVYSSEIFPLKLRAQGAGVGVAVNRATNATMSMTFLSLKDAITIGGALFLFAGN
nr:probable polyol transporter 6 [Tanacetum cinerariifolium]